MIEDRLYELLDEKLEFLKLHEVSARFVTRVRGGKVQKRKKVPPKGFTIKGGKIVKKTAAMELAFKRRARKGKAKRKAKMARAMMRRKKSLRLRKQRSIGVRRK